MELSLVIGCVLVAVGVLTENVSGGCYFPEEFHGTFLIQTQAASAYGGSVVSYSEITIEADAIPPWGRCHRKRGDNIILKDSTGTEDCMRCLHLTMKTPNVIHIYTEGLARCYTNEEAARATCPDDRSVHERRFKEIILYRKQDSAGLSSIQNVFCPINGRYRFQYRANGDEFRCHQPFSEISNCPNGNQLSVRFRQCSFPDLDVSFVCLGNWLGPNREKYLALMDLREDPESRPKYRCGIYKEEPGSGRIFVSLSSDSTCTTQLTSAHNGYESLVLTPLPERSLPAQVEASRCRFPEWSQGKWEDMMVDGDSFTFKDRKRFVTLTGRCVTRHNSTPNDKFIIYTVTQCGEELYYCIWARRRGINVIEFQLGSSPSGHFSENLCSDQQFKTSTWITQGKEIPLQVNSCPITGDYTGVVPGTTGVCARVASDCNNPDIMFYSVSSCENRTHIYEEREYRCLGSWEENGVTYTYTQRRDVPEYQCFSGKIMRYGEEAYIKEAGDSCVRGEDPLLYGMKITKQGKQASCPQSQPSPYIPTSPVWKVSPRPSPMVPPLHPNTHDPYWYRAVTQYPSTKPWKPITGRPRQNEIDSSYAGTGRHVSSPTVLVFLLTMWSFCGR